MPCRKSLRVIRRVGGRSRNRLVELIFHFVSLKLSNITDIIYIGNENSAHKDAILMSLAAKKAVLCEKPLCINAAEVEECIKFAKQQQCFLMEVKKFV